INSRGVVFVEEDTSIADPYAPNCWVGECFVQHAVKWQGVPTDLGALPGVNSSFASGINDAGELSGTSENSIIDPLTGFPEVRAVHWKHGTIKDLGTLGGNASAAAAINNHGLIVGEALNTTPDSYSSGFAPGTGFFPVATQRHAVLWKHENILDLGTLGGPDSLALFVNERGQIAGPSYTNSIPNSANDWCGVNIPPTHPFIILKHGKMTDLGTLGGTCGIPDWLNNEGQIVGFSTLSGDQTVHPFLWTNPGPMQDLGTLGGSTGQAYSINDGGDAAGWVTKSGDVIYRAVLWKNEKHRKPTDLGVLKGYVDSFAYSINSKLQIIGCLSNSASACTVAFLWENGRMFDLNKLIPPHSGFTLEEPQFISDAGEIEVIGRLKNGNLHAFVLIPN
ncbi:MAG TPA: hypothetical protein VIY29_05430, partial [Ktedonobacteraceae bacterium]